MRLVCPNCGAQYEVDDRVIPDGGRDVQCSNCGHAWYQRPAGWDAAQTADADADLVAPPPSEDDAPEPVDDDAPPAPPTPPSEPDPTPQDDAPAQEAPAEAAPQRREMDDGVRDILAEEAKRELDARARDGGGVEEQPDLGLDSFTDPEEERRRIARERMAAMRGIEEGETLDAEVAPEEVVAAPEARGKDLFPDIDEINSTLEGSADVSRRAARKERKPTETAETDAAPAAAASGTGFRRGFSVMILLGTLAFAAYVLAPNIVTLVPAAADVMATYVDFVNGLLDKLEDMMAAATLRIQGEG